MFALRIHTHDTYQPEFSGTEYLVDGASNPNFTKNSDDIAGGSNPNFTEESYIRDDLQGVVHLFRNRPKFPYSPEFSLFDAVRTKFVFILYVPSDFSTDQFIAFCGPHTEYFSHLCFISDDAVEVRYSVLIKLVNLTAADRFCRSYKGKRFRPSETDVCHIYHPRRIVFVKSAKIASTPEMGYTELPQCRVCLERLDPSTSALKITGCNHSFECSCSCLAKLSCQVCLLCQQKDGKPTCEVCGTTNNLWACLICGSVGCGRYEGGHAFKHHEHAEHSYALEIKTLKIWDYLGDKYVHRSNQSESDSQSIAKKHQSFSLEDDEIYSSKLERVIDQHNILFETQMTCKRRHFETLLADAKSQKEKSIAEAIKKAEAEIRCQYEKAHTEIKSLKKAHEEIYKEQETLKTKYEEIKAREDAAMELNYIRYNEAVAKFDALKEKMNPTAGATSRNQQRGRRRRG